MYNSKITSFGMAVPKKVVTNDDLSKIVDTSDEWIYSRTGIKERRISSGESTADLCTMAFQNLMSKSNISPLDVDLIIVATMSPDYTIPSTACVVQGRVGAINAFAFDLCAACSGFVFALSTADKFIRTGAYKNIVVIGGETISKFIDWKDRSTCVLFGDGAGAALIQRNEEDYSFVIAEDLNSDGKQAFSLTSSFFPLQNPFVQENNDTENAYYDKPNSKWIYMNGRDIFNFATKKVPLSINKLMEESKTEWNSIKYIIPHQANSRIVDVIARKLKLDISKFFMNLDRFGNTSAACIPIALCEMTEKGLLNKNDKIIITGFGGGLTWGTMLLQL